MSMHELRLEPRGAAPQCGKRSEVPELCQGAFRAAHQTQGDSCGVHRNVSKLSIVATLRIDEREQRDLVTTCCERPDPAYRVRTVSIGHDQDTPAPPAGVDDRSVFMPVRHHLCRRCRLSAMNQVTIAPRDSAITQVTATCRTWVELAAPITSATWRVNSPGMASQGRPPAKT